MHQLPPPVVVGVVGVMVGVVGVMVGPVGIVCAGGDVGSTIGVWVGVVPPPGVVGFTMGIVSS